MGIDKITGGEYGTHITRINVKKGGEDEVFMQFFKNQLVILDGEH